MPAYKDSLGRYYLSTIRDRIQRLLDSLQLVVATSGIETSATLQDQSYSNTDIVNQVNESLTSIWAEMITGREVLFAQTVLLSTLANNPGPYAFPANMIQLRWMKWKNPNVPFVPATSPKPTDWYPMAFVDDPADWGNQEAFNAPTLRWEGGEFLLNNLVAQDNINGIQCNIVAMPDELVNDNDVIQTPQFVRIMQQAVIYDAAYTLAFSKHKQVTDELGGKRQEWHTKLMVLVENAYNVMSVQMIAPSRMPANTYTGRRKRIARGGFGRGSSF
jgi:hypothetical protein